REVLLKYRDGAEILLLGYSIAAADVTPLALGSRRLGAEVSQGILTLTLGTVAVEQNRRLFEIDPAAAAENFAANAAQMLHGTDRKSTRLNSSHVSISYAVFCLKKKNYVTV